MIDIHSHSSFSPDSKESCEDMVQYAIDNKLDIYGISDHFDLEMPNYLLPWPVPDIEEYSKKMLQLRQKTNDVKFLFGAEFGYSDIKEYLDEFVRLSNNYPFDYIINSVHIIEGDDGMDKRFFIGRTKQEAYKKGLDAIIRSVDAPYYFSTIGHIEYMTRIAPYEDKALRVEDFNEEFKTLFTKAINRQVAIEVNSKNIVFTNNVFAKASLDILKYYYDLGGRMITFGSDAHFKNDIARNYEYVAKTVKDLGFKEFTYFINRQPKFIKI